MPFNLLDVVDRTSSLLDAFLSDRSPRVGVSPARSADSGFLPPSQGGGMLVGFDGSPGYMPPEVSSGGFLQALSGLISPQVRDTPFVAPRLTTATPPAAVTPPPQTTPLGQGATRIAQGQEAFVQSMAPLARRLEQRYGVPREVTVAIAANETGYGNPKYIVGNNLFGIKAVPGQPGVTSPTWEVINGQRVDMPATFAAYDSPDAAGEAFAQLLTRRYQNAFTAMQRLAQQGASRQEQIDAFARGVYEGGYATDPQYPQKIGSITRAIGPLLEKNTAPPTPNADGLVFPVQGYTGTVDLHHGQVPGASDLFAELGTPVLAMRSGRVTNVTRDTQDPVRNPGGNSVTVLGDDGKQYYYAHMGEPPTVGSTVQAGQQIGVVGRTGNAAQVNYPAGQGHLHIGIGDDIIDGTGPFGGTGGTYDAVRILRALLDATAGN